MRAILASGLLLVSACGTGDTLLVASGFTDEVVVVRASDGEIVDRIAVDPRAAETDEPHGLALAPDGRFWYVSVSHGEPTLWKFERPSNRLVGRVRLETFGAGRIGITPDGQTALVPDYYRDGGAAASHVAVIRLHDLARLRAPIVCPTPHDAAISPDGRLAAVTCVASDEIVMLETSTGEIANRFPVDSAPGPPGEPRFRPMNGVWSSTGHRLYVTLHHANIVRAFDPSGRVLGEVATGHSPAQIALAPDGAVVVTANRGDGTASVIQVPELREIRRIHLGVAHPHGVTLGPDGTRAFLTYEGDAETLGGVLALDLADGSILWTRGLGSYATGLIYLPDDRP
jgi:DNA-binding beta-propeller fold protein YncE